MLAYLPAVGDARLESGQALRRLPGTDFFWCQGAPESLPGIHGSTGNAPTGAPDRGSIPTASPRRSARRTWCCCGSGNHVEAWKLLGAHPANLDAVQGVRFAVWAPNAERVSVVGPFCDWDGRRLPMRVMGGSGVWELFVPGLPVGEIYKFEIRNRETGGVELKGDPYARAMELRPSTASHRHHAR